LFHEAKTSPEKTMKWTYFAAVGAIAAGLWLSAEAAQPASSAETSTAPAVTDSRITFAEYREWRLNYIERRRSELAMQLSASDLASPQKSRLEQAKAYYDWFAGLPDTDRDRRFRERFDRIDANHDGQIDAGERASWRDKQRAFYHRDTPRDGGARQSSAAVR
jgi:hypothetical protein